MPVEPPVTSIGEWRPARAWSRLRECGCGPAAVAPPRTRRLPACSACAGYHARAGHRASFVECRAHRGRRAAASLRRALHARARRLHSPASPPPPAETSPPLPWAPRPRSPSYVLGRGTGCAPASCAAAARAATAGEGRVEVGWVAGEIPVKCAGIFRCVRRTPAGGAGRTYPLQTCAPCWMLSVHRDVAASGAVGCRARGVRRCTARSPGAGGGALPEGRAPRLKLRAHPTIDRALLECSGCVDGHCSRRRVRFSDCCGLPRQRRRAHPAPRRPATSDAGALRGGPADRCTRSGVHISGGGLFRLPRGGALLRGLPVVC